MNDTIPPLAAKIVAFLRQKDIDGTSHKYLEEEVARMIDEHVPLKQFEQECEALDKALFTLQCAFIDVRRIIDNAYDAANKEVNKLLKDFI